MNITRRFYRLMVVAVFAVATLSSQAALPAIYNMVPDNALAVFAIPSLNNIQTKVADLDKQLGLGLPPLQMVLPLVKGELGMTKGINDNGGVVVAVTGPPALDGSSPPPAVVIVAVTDYKAFLNNFNAEDNGGITSARLKGEEVFIKSVGGYAILGSTKQAAAGYKKPAGGKVSRLAGAYGNASLSRSDVAIYLDMEQIGPMILPFIQIGMMQAEAQLQNGDIPADQVEMVKSMFKLYGGMLKAIINDSQSITIGLDLSKKGIGLSYTAQFKDDSNLGLAFANAPKNKLKFDRLPNRPYLMLMAGDYSQLPMAEWGKAAAKAFAGNDGLSKLMRSSMAMSDYGVFQGAYYTPGANGPITSFLSGVTVMDVKNPEKYLVQMEKMLKDLGDADVDIPIVFDFKKNVLEIDDHSVHQFSMKMNFPPEIAAQMGPFIDIIGNQAGYLTATKSSVIQTVGLDPTLLREALKVNDGGGKLGSTPGIGSVGAELGEDRIAEVYINIAEIGKMGLGFAKMFMPELNVKIPANVEPIGVGISGGNQGLATRTYVPMSLVKAIADIAKKFAPGLGGGGGGGGAPLAQPLSKNVQELNGKNFNKATGSGVVVVEYYAGWSGKSKKQGVIISKLAKELKGKVKFARVDIDKNAKISREQGIAVIPSIVIYKNGSAAKKMNDLVTADALRNAINAAK